MNWDCVPWAVPAADRQHRAARVTAPALRGVADRRDRPLRLYAQMPLIRKMGMHLTPPITIVCGHFGNSSSKRRPQCGQKYTCVSPDGHPFICGPISMASGWQAHVISGGQGLSAVQICRSSLGVVVGGVKCTPIIRNASINEDHKRELPAPADCRIRRQGRKVFLQAKRVTLPLGPRRRDGGRTGSIRSQMRQRSMFYYHTMHLRFFHCIFGPKPL